MATAGIVTGAASGMGRACAQRLSRFVDAMILVDKNPEALSASFAGLSAASGETTMETLVADVTDHAGLVHLRSQVAELGDLRVVAHAAGVSPVMATWQDVLTVDLVGTAMLVDALRPLVTTGTAVVCFASIGADIGTGEVIPDALTILDQPLEAGFPEHLHKVVKAVEDPVVAYSWAKLGVRRLVQREATAFGRAGARINCVSPGMIDTPMTRREAAEYGVDHILMEETPLRREGWANEVASAVEFLISDEASFINGTNLTVDGGLVAALLSGTASLSDGDGPPES